jgi:4-hydroxybenzoate polyprenyltransferase
MTIGPETHAHGWSARVAVLTALRPHQWTKNLLLFAGIIFAGHLQDSTRLSHAVAAFAAFCMLSSAGYLVNDVVDAPRDRLHETKRFRPIARGDVSPRTAVAIAVALAVAGLALAASLGIETLVFAAAFIAGQFAYTLLLKRLYLVDALAIAGLFVVRAAAGAAAVDVHISDWLLVCTGLLAMFLTFAKRRGEVVTVSADRAVGRAVLKHYSLARLGPLVWSTAAGVCAAYTVYAFTAHDSTEMRVTVPFVLFGLARYLYLIQRRDLGEEPDRVLLNDPPILVSVLIWAIVAATALNAA